MAPQGAHPAVETDFFVFLFFVGFVLSTVVSDLVGAISGSFGFYAHVWPSTVEVCWYYAHNQKGLIEILLQKTFDVATS